MGESKESGIAHDPTCPACEGRPAPGNNPCYVCGCSTRTSNEDIVERLRSESEGGIDINQNDWRETCEACRKAEALMSEAAREIERLRSAHETSGCAACDRGVLTPHDVEATTDVCDCERDGYDTHHHLCRKFGSPMKANDARPPAQAAAASFRSKK